jgi:hypothetical protein
MSFLSQSSPATAENSPGHTPAPSVRAPSNPFSTPPYSRPASTIGVRSGYQYAPVPGTGYFRSRRVRKEDAVPLPARKKSKKESLLWIMPLCGLILGLGITGVVIYLKLQTIQHHKYCPVLNDDFSSGTLDPKIWTKEVQVGGFGSVHPSNVIVRQCTNVLLATVNLNRQLPMTRMSSSKTGSCISSQLCKTQL